MNIIQFGLKVVRKLHFGESHVADHVSRTCQQGHVEDHVNRPCRQGYAAGHVSKDTWHNQIMTSFKTKSTF
jgi:hypothetical protein